MFVKFASIIVAVHQSMIIPLESSGPIVAPVKSALDKFTKNLESTVQNPVVGSRQIGQESITQLYRYSLSHIRHNC